MYLCQSEIDFVVADAQLAIQISYSIKGDDTFERETTPLFHFMKNHEGWQSFIITYDEKDTIEKDGERIEVVPIWKWLL